MAKIFVDADIIAYEAAAQAQFMIDWDDGAGGRVYTDLPLALEVAAQTIGKIVRYCGPDLVLCWSGHENFRKVINPQYKANRIGKVRPTLLKEVRREMSREYPSMTEVALEADDLLSIMATAAEDTVIATIDKDLMNTPGWHFNWRRPGDDVFNVGYIEAEANFYRQILTGDPTDGYSGCPGVGPVRADKILDGTRGDGVAAWYAILEAYDSKGLTAEHALLMARMAYILQHGDYNFKTGEVKLWVPHA